MLDEQQLGSAQVNLKIFCRDCAWWQYSSGTIHIISAKIRNNVHGATTALSDAERVAVAVMLH